MPGRQRGSQPTREGGGLDVADTDQRAHELAALVESAHEHEHDAGATDRLPVLVGETTPALAALGELAGLVDVDDWAGRYRGDTDTTVTLAELLGVATRQLQGRALVDPELKRRVAAAATAWAEPTPVP